MEKKKNTKKSCYFSKNLDSTKTWMQHFCLNKSETLSEHISLNFFFFLQIEQQDYIAGVSVFILLTQDSSQQLLLLSED